MGVETPTPARSGTAARPSNQPPGKSGRKRKAAIRKRLPRTSAVGLTVASVGGREAPTIPDIMRRAREAIPDYKVFGIKWIKPKRMATGGLLLEIPGAASFQQADALASRLREVFSEEAGLRVTRPVRRVELRIVGFDDSTAPQEIASAVSAYGAGGGRQSRGDPYVPRRPLHGMGAGSGSYRSAPGTGGQDYTGVVPMPSDPA